MKCIYEDKSHEIYEVEEDYTYREYIDDHQYKFVRDEDNTVFIFHLEEFIDVKDRTFDKLSELTNTTYEKLTFKKPGVDRCLRYDYMKLVDGYLFETGEYCINNVPEDLLFLLNFGLTLHKLYITLIEKDCSSIALFNGISEYSATRVGTWKLYNKDGSVRP